MRSKRSRIRLCQIKFYFADRLCCIYMKTAVRIVFQYLCNLSDGLHSPKLTVNCTDCTKYCVLTQKRPEMVYVDHAVRLYIHNVDLPALFLQKCQRATNGGMLQKSGNDVFAPAPVGKCQPLDGKVIRFAGTACHNDLARLDMKQFGHKGYTAVNFILSFPSCAMGRIGIGKYLRCPDVFLQNTAIGRRVCGVIKVYHVSSPVHFCPRQNHPGSGGIRLQDDRI